MWNTQQNSEHPHLHKLLHGHHEAHLPRGQVHVLIADDVVHHCGQRQNPPNVQEAEHRGLSQPRGSVVGDGHPSPLKKRKEGKFTN